MSSSHDRRRGRSAVRCLDGEPGPAGQHVIKVAGAFVSNRVDGLGPQVVRRAGQRLSERGIRLHQVEQLVDQVAVAVKQVLKAREVQAVLGRQLIAAVPQRQVAGCACKRNAIGARWRHPLAESARRFVHGLRGHDAVRRELAARHHYQARGGPADRVLAGQFRRRACGAGHQRAEPGVDADHVLATQRLTEDRVDMIQQVVDVPRVRARIVLAEIPVRVRRSDDPVLPPRDDEQHASLRARDDPGR